jgi:cyclopropane fatty-acyl-phospholipid synthase-like methyltransferase
MSRTYSEAVQKTQAYYNSDETDRFYSKIWRGFEDLHLGIFASADEPIDRANRRTVERMAELVGSITSDTRVIDLGSGYGGTARYLVQVFGCSVVCLNLSEKQNAHNRRINAADGLSDKIEVIEGNFESVPLDDASFDLVWSQDAMLHSNNRAQILAEAYRLLRPGGEFIFTDPLQSEDVPEAVLGPIYARGHLESMATFQFYRETAAALGFQERHVIDLSEHLTTTYSRVYDDLVEHYAELNQDVSREYLDRMLVGLQHWVSGGEKGYLRWGILHFRKS